MRHPFWLAARTGQGWRNESILTLLSWFEVHVDANGWAKRLASTRARFEKARERWTQDDSEPVHDGSDLMAWYAFQARAFACPEERHNYFEPEGFRVAPIFSRLAQVRSELEHVGEIGERIRELMAPNNAQPDTDLFELLVAAAYRRCGWRTVGFTNRQPGVATTEDLVVAHGRRKYAVECKRVQNSQYEREEIAQVERLAEPVHTLARRTGRWLSVSVVFGDEPRDLPDDFLLRAVEECLSTGLVGDRWDNGGSTAMVQNIDPRPLRAVLMHDNVLYRSSRMVELLTGHYISGVEYSLRADWRPAQDRVFYAADVSHASVVAWRVRAPAAVAVKSKHFRAIVGRAADQLPGDLPGVVHVGYESVGNNAMDRHRHEANAFQMHRFDPRATNLRWVYASYWAPEHTTQRNESWAVSETQAWHRIGHHRLSQPLPGQLLLDDRKGLHGHHWL